MPELSEIHAPHGPGAFWHGRIGKLIALRKSDRLRRMLSKMLDENEFLSPYGIRSLSKFHERASLCLPREGQEYRVEYLPGESDTGMFGGNSNWRGPVWMPVNALIIRALLNFYLYYGDNFLDRMPHRFRQDDEPLPGLRGYRGPAKPIFLRNEQGQRPGVWRHGKVSVRSSLARPPPVL